MALGFEVRLKFDIANRAVREGAERGVRLAVEHVLGVSGSRVPIEEGTLERSGVASTDGLTGAVSYDTPYAVIQHEDLTFQHDAGRSAKYLEGAFNSEIPVVGAIIAGAIKART